MFCHKCGTQITKESAFCPTCGAKLMGSVETQHAPIEPASTADRHNDLATSQTEPTADEKGKNPQRAGCLAPLIATLIIPSIIFLGLGHPVTLGVLVIALLSTIIGGIFAIKGKAKKSKSLIIGIAVEAVVIIILIIIPLVAGGKVDYIETVKAYRPLTNMGYNQTYQEVLSHFINDLKWSYEKADDGAEVIAQGTSPLHGNMEIVISVIPIPGENNLFAIDLMSITAGSEKSIGPLVQLNLLGMFGAYAQGSAWEGVSLPIQPSQETDTPGESGSGEIPSNHDDAYKIAKAWLDAHPDMNETVSKGEQALYQSDGIEYYVFDFAQMYYANLLVNSKTGALSIMVNHDGEEPYSEIEPLDDYYNRFYGTSDTGTASGELLYQGTPVYQYFGYTIDEVIDSLGPPLSYEEYNGGNYHYDGITFICDDSTGKILSIELDPSACEIDGISLDKPEPRLLGILGAPTARDFIRDIQGGTNEVVGSYINYKRKNYSFSLIMQDSEEIPTKIKMWPPNE